MLRAGIVDEDEAVEAVVPIFRVTAGPRRVLGPIAERCELRMRRNEILHRNRVLARRREQQLVEALRRRDREGGGIDHGAAPILSVRRCDAYPQAPYADRRIRRVRIGGTKIEAPENRILPAGENPGPRQLGPGSVCFEHAGKTDALGMVAAMAERRPGGGASAANSLLGVRRSDENHPAV